MGRKDSSESDLRPLAVGLCLVAVLLAALLSACGRTSVEPPLRMAGNVWPGYEPFYLARDLGYYRTPVQLQAMPAASAAIAAFRAGNAEAVELTLDEALLLLEDGMDVRIVLWADASNGADVLMAKPEIISLPALRAKRVGVETNALGAYMLSRVLEIAKLTPAEIQIVPLTPDEQETAYRSNDVDAVVCFEPVRTKLLKQGARILFDSSRIPDEIVDVLVVRADILQQRPEAVAQIQEAWFRALQYIRAHPEEACERMAKREQISGAEFQAALKLLKLPTHAENKQFLTGSNPGVVPAAQRLMNAMLEQKLLRHPVDTAILGRDVQLAPEPNGEAP